MNMNIQIKTHKIDNFVVYITRNFFFHPMMIIECKKIKNITQNIFNTISSYKVL